MSEVAQKNALVLALVGDAVMTLATRQSLATTTNLNADEIHKKVAKIICAKGQSLRFEKIKGELTDVEENIANRARNAKHHTTPKSCTLVQYRSATALEAVIGYNFLVGNTQRCNQLIGIEEVEC